MTQNGIKQVSKSNNIAKLLHPRYGCGIDQIKNEISMQKHTPLYDLHIEQGAKMIPFAGWLMPLQYEKGILQEHLFCRSKATLFDVSHMAQIDISGEKTTPIIDKLMPISADQLKPDHAKYSFLPNEKGGVIDDLIICKQEGHFRLVVNASRTDVVLEHLNSYVHTEQINHRTDLSLLALQGPSAEPILAQLLPGVQNLQFMQAKKFQYQTHTIDVFRLGYTGEDGFEISVKNELATSLAQELLRHKDCIFAGLGARDTLRLEAGLCLYGQELDETTSPIEAGLGWTIPKAARDTARFIGAAPILNALSNRVHKKLVGIQPNGRAPARAGTKIYSLSCIPIGNITSGGFGPSVNRPVAMGYVDMEHANIKDEVHLIVRNKTLKAHIIKLPFVPHQYRHI